MILVVKWNLVVAASSARWKRTSSDILLNSFESSFQASAPVSAVTSIFSVCETSPLFMDRTPAVCACTSILNRCTYVDLFILLIYSEPLRMGSFPKKGARAGVSSCSPSLSEMATSGIVSPKEWYTFTSTFTTRGPHSHLKECSKTGQYCANPNFNAILDVEIWIDSCAGPYTLLMGTPLKGVRNASMIR